MLAICPECKNPHPFDEKSEKMLDHPDPNGTFSCVGVGMESGTIVPDNKTKAKKSRFGSKIEHDLDVPLTHVPVEATPTFIFSDSARPTLSFSLADLLKPSKKKK